MADCPTPDKHRHATRKAAERALESMDAAGIVGGDLMLRVYRCPCGAWHVGHRKGTRSHQLKVALDRGRRAAARARKGRKR